MASRVCRIFLFLIFAVLFNFVYSSVLTNMIDENILTDKAYVFWPNATVPFFIDDEHFDKEQQLSILTALSLFAFKTCLKFAPVMARPEANEHVLVLENPTGIRKCTISTDAHSIDEPHKVTLGYDCLKSPNIDMMIMKALGFPFEHDRAIRDMYVEVQFENVEPGSLDLFNRDLRLPVELRAIPYDINSVMHFGEREFSANGHRTIIFKNRNLRQERFGLSPLDLRKIDVVYGPECLKRDRQEKIELCQNYPGVARKKRDISSQSLRVNPDITPPPAVAEVAASEAYANKIINDLNIDKEVQDLVDQVHKVNAIALANARARLCNGSKDVLRTDASESEPKPKLLDIVGQVASNAQGLVAFATKNLTEFCSEATSIYAYQRGSCPFFDKDRCEKSYKSTKSGAVKYSTQHRPLIRQSTKPQHTGKKNIYHNWLRSGNSTGSNVTSDVSGTSSVTAASSRKKRDLPPTNLPASVDVLRMGTKLLGPPKGIYVPNYRASKVTDSASNVRRKREAPGPNDKNENLKKHLSNSNDARRRFESQRFRSKKEVVEKGEYERGKKEREWDNSGVSAERNRQNEDYERPSERHSPRVRERPRSRPQAEPHGRERVEDEVPSGPASLKKARSRFRPVSNSRPNNSVETSVKRTKGKNKDDQYPVDQGPGTGTKISNEDYQDEKEPPAQDKEPGDQDKEPPMPEKAKESAHMKSQKRGRWKQRDTETTEHVEETRIVEKISIPPEPVLKSRNDHNERGDSMSVLPRVVELSKQNKEFYNERTWPDGVVRYVLMDPGDGEADMADVRQRLEAVNEILKRRTCARMEEITEEEADSYEDYLVLDNSADYVTGRVGGKQNFGVVELLKGGQHRQHAAMMVMAMLGFYFEISRHDRDKYIRVHMRHVRPDKLHHFEKIREDATFPLPYDYQSATHPAWQFWRQLGQTGISTVATFKETDPDGSLMKSLGQNHQLLSELDIVKINSVYGIDCFMKDPPEPKKEETKEEEPRDEDPYAEYKGPQQRKKKRKPVETEDHRDNYGKRQKKQNREESAEEFNRPTQRKKKVRQENSREEQRKKKVRQEDSRDDYAEETNAKQRDKDNRYDREEEINNAKQRKRKRPADVREKENNENSREENFAREQQEY